MSDGPRTIVHLDCDTCGKKFDKLIMYQRGGLWYCAPCNKQVNEIMKCGGCGQIISGKWSKPPGATSKWHVQCWEQQKGTPLGTQAIPELDDNKGEGVRPVKVTAFNRLQLGMGESVSTSTPDEDYPSRSTTAPASTYATPETTKSSSTFCVNCGASRPAGSKFCPDCGGS